MKINFNNSIIESYIWHNERFLIKRDDLISPFINGNKVYKFYFLLNRDFEIITSYGGNQSNAMATLSYIAKAKNARFVYFTRELPTLLLNQVSGNLKFALENKMELKISNDMKNDCIAFANENNAIFIPQGGAMNEAREGIAKLAQDIINLNLENLCVFYSSGTGTSSLFLQEYLKKYNIDVFTTPCVGNKNYLYKQFLILSKKKQNFPQILQTKDKFTFAKPNIKLLNIYREFLKQGIEFDLLYDCVMWHAIIDNFHIIKNYKNRLFLHSGGIFGNKSQIERYEYYNMF